MASAGMSDVSYSQRGSRLVLKPGGLTPTLPHLWASPLSIFVCPLVLRGTYSHGAHAQLPDIFGVGQRYSLCEHPWAPPEEAREGSRTCMRLSFVSLIRLRLLHG